MLCGFSAAGLFFSCAKIHLKAISANDREKNHFSKDLKPPLSEEPSHDKTLL